VRWDSKAFSVNQVFAAVEVRCRTVLVPTSDGGLTQFEVTVEGGWPLAVAL
jgi:hypothetical protein